MELPFLSGAGAFLLLIQAVSASSPHFPISHIPQLALTEISLPASTAAPLCSLMGEAGGGDPPESKHPLGSVPSREGMVNLLKR